MRNLSLQKIFLNVYKVGLVFLVLTLPLANSDLFYLFYPKLYPSRVILVVLIFVSAIFLGVALLKKKSVRGVWENLKSDTFLKILLLLFLVRLVSISSSLNYTASFLLLSFFASMMALYLILKWVARRDFVYLNKLYFFHLFVMVLVGLYGLLQAFLVPFHKILPGVLLGGTFLRVPATFYDANHLPAYLLTGLPFLLVLAWTRSEKYLSRPLLLLTGLLALVVFLSFSRSGIAGFLLSFLLIFLAGVAYRYWQKVAQLLAVLAILGFFVFLSGRTQYSLTSRLFSSFSYAERSTVAHVALLYGELKLFLEKPLLGVGYGSFSEYFRRSRMGEEHAIVDPATQVRIPPHSLWLEALSETGLLGFSLYLSLILLMGESLWRALRRAKLKKDRLYLLALLAGFVGINFSSIFYSYNLEFFWFYLIFCYLYAGHFLSAAAKVAVPLSADAPEKLPWKEIFLAGILLSLTAFSFFLRLGDDYLSGEAAGRTAYLAKWILRRWEMGWPNFWVLYFGDNPYLWQSPLFSWLGAVVMFLYYITTFSARFWSAFFGWLAVGLTAALAARRWGKMAGFLAGLLMTLLPFYLSLSRSGTPATAYLALILAGVYLATFLKHSPSFWLFLGLVEGFFFLTEQKLAFLSFTVFVFYGLFLLGQSYRYGRLKAAAVLWFLVFPLVSFSVFFPWYVVMGQKFGNAFRDSFSFIPDLASLNVLPLLFYPLAASGLSLMLLRFWRSKLTVKVWLLVGVLFVAISYGQVVIFGQDNSLPGRERRDILRLIHERYQREPNGIIPILLEASRRSYIFHYYSDVELEWRAGNSGLRDYFLSNGDRTFFAILPGEDLRLLRRQIPELSLGTQVLAVENDFVLVKKW